MTVEEYISSSFEAAQRYKDQVLSGEIITNKWIKGAIRRSISDALRDDIEFRRDKVERVFNFFFHINIKKKTEYSRFILSDYQAWIISEIFGWYLTGTEKRRYRYALIHTARKSGKTLFGACIQLYLFLSDGELNSEVYQLANSREQATTGLEMIKEVVRHSPVLMKRVDIQKYKLENAGANRKKNGRSILMVKASQARKLDSLNVHAAVLDEFHEYKDLSLFNVMKSGTLNRDNPLIMITSTAGFNRSLPYFNMVEVGKKVCLGDVVSDSFFYAIYTLDDEDDYADPEVWVKSNPNVGVTVTLADLITEYNTAKIGTQEELIGFLTKNLNIYTDAINQWLPEEYLQRCSNNFLKITDYADKVRYRLTVGIDLSHNTDLSSVVYLFEDLISDKLYAFPTFYATQGTNKQRPGALDISPWIKSGCIMECSKPVIDLDRIAADIIEVHKHISIDMLYFDPFNAERAIVKIQGAGIPTKSFAQTPMNFNLPTKEMESRIYSGGIEWNNSEVMNWQMRNIVLQTDNNNNYKPGKKVSLDAIDGPIAIIQSIAAVNPYKFDPELLAKVYS